MRDLSRRLTALELRPSNRGFRRVVIITEGQPAPPDSDNIHIIRIVAADHPGTANWIQQNRGNTE